MFRLCLSVRFCIWLRRLRYIDHHAGLFLDALLGGTANRNGKRKIFCIGSEGFRNGSGSTGGYFPWRRFERKLGLSNVRCKFSPPRSMRIQALRKFTAPGGIVRRYSFAGIANASALVTFQHGVEISSEIAAWAGTRDTLPGRKISSK